MARAMMPTNWTRRTGAITAACANAWKECLVHRRPAAAARRIVEARQIIVDQGGTVQKFDGGGRGGGQGGPVLGTGACDREAQPRANARTAGKHGVAHGSEKCRRRFGAARESQRTAQRSLDSGHGIHFSLRRLSVNITCQLRL